LIDLIIPKYSTGPIPKKNQGVVTNDLNTFQL